MRLMAGMKNYWIKTKGLETEQKRGLIVHLLCVVLAGEMKMDREGV